VAKTRELSDVTAGVLVVVVSAVILGTGNAWLEMRSFIDRGGRCTASDCASLASSIQLLGQQLTQFSEDTEDMIEEAKRLQQQIDRLEKRVFLHNNLPPLEPYAD